jgi:hypothetical protein
MDPHRCADCPLFNEWRALGILPCCHDMLDPEPVSIVPPRILTGGAAVPVPA